MQKKIILTVYFHSPKAQFLKVNDFQGFCEKKYDVKIVDPQKCNHMITVCSIDKISQITSHDSQKISVINRMKKRSGIKTNSNVIPPLPCFNKKVTDGSTLLIRFLLNICMLHMRSIDIWSTKFKNHTSYQNTFIR